MDADLHVAGFRENTQNRVELPTIKYVEYPSPVVFHCSERSLPFHAILSIFRYKKEKD
jgi:hypothetical protein